MLLLLLLLAASTDTPPQHQNPVAPHIEAKANAGVKPFAGKAVFRAIHGSSGIDRVVDVFVIRKRNDPRIADIFKGQDLVSLRRVRKEQFCYMFGGAASTPDGS